MTGWCIQLVRWVDVTRRRFTSLVNGLLQSKSLVCGLSFGRLLSKHGGSLASFFQSMCSSRPSPHDDGSPGAVVWPIPIPYVELFMRRSGGLTSWKKRRLCLQIVTLNWLWLGRPSVAPFFNLLGSEAHIEAVEDSATPRTPS